jgi:predicted esterase YcpF (UPF0227 family)
MTNFEYLMKNKEELVNLMVAFSDDENDVLSELTGYWCEHHCSHYGTCEDCLRPEIGPHDIVSDWLNDPVEKD